MAGIEDRIGLVDLNSPRINTDYRAALHQKYSSAPTNLNNVRQLLSEDFVLSTSSRDTKTLHSIHDWIFRNLDREIITLSPLGVFGLDQILTDTSPLKVAHVTGRTADVVADPTIQLAGEAYRRRKSNDNSELSIGAFHQCTRLQHYMNKAFKPVFEMFGTTDSVTKFSGTSYEAMRISQLMAGYERLINAHLYDPGIQIVLSNIAIADKILENYQNQDGLNLEQRTELVSSLVPQNLRGAVDISQLETGAADGFFESNKLTRERDRLRSLITTLAPDTEDKRMFVHIDRMQGVGHYNGLAFMINVNGINLADGGSVDWINRLTANNKERTVVSGFGTTLLTRMIGLQEGNAL